VRGEIVTVPAKKGDPRNLTQTPGTHERGPAWSPDGKSVAYFSDASGEYELHIAPQDGKGEVKAFPLDGTGFYNGLSWSPDSKKLAFEDNGRNLYVIVLSSGEVRTIDQEPIYNPGPFGNMDPVWSPDSGWLAYTVNNMSNMEQVHLYSMDQDEVFTITDGLSDVGNPTFDASGKYLYLFGSTDAGPVRQWFAMSNRDMEMSRNLYLVTLQKDIPSPLAKESDEEEGADKDESEDENGDDAEEKDADDTPITIDFDGMGERILTIPVDAGNYFSLQAGAADTIFYLKAPVDAGGPSSSGTKLMMYDLAEREEKELFDANAFVVSADGKKVLYNKGETWGIVEAGEKPEKGKGTVALDAVQIRIDPAAEWGLAGHARALRTLPPRPRLSHGSQPVDPLDGQRAGGGPQLGWRRRHVARFGGHSGRSPGRRLWGGERPLSHHQGLRRSQLEPGADLAPHRARGGCEGGSIPAGG
jgi:tricorn protease